MAKQSIINTIRAKTGMSRSFSPVDVLGRVTNQRKKLTGMGVGGISRAVAAGEKPILSAFAEVMPNIFGKFTVDTPASATAPPKGAYPGETFIVGAKATGDWLGKDGQIAIWNGAAWQFQPLSATPANSTYANPLPQFNAEERRPRRRGI
jgi:hypothetical protein